MGPEGRGDLHHGAGVGSAICARARSCDCVRWLAGLHHALHADSLKDDGGQPFVPMTIAQMLEQMGVVGTARSPCAANAHRQGARDGAGVLAAAAGCWRISEWLYTGAAFGGEGWRGVCRG
jgi:hypothetical protein